MRIVVTDADSFLGWHTRLRLHAKSDHHVIPIGYSNWDDLPAAVAHSEAVIHVGAHHSMSGERSTRDDVARARDVNEAIRRLERSLPVIYANPVNTSHGTPGGTEGAAAAYELRNGIDTVVEVELPALFGEHGQASDSSFVASLVEAAAHGRTPEVSDERARLLHVQSAAAGLIAALTPNGGETHILQAAATSALHVWRLLRQFADAYSRGEIPDLSTEFRVDLFNTYRASLFPAHYPKALNPHSDHRGTFIETVRSHGGQGQTSVSTTLPGMTRGNHYHLRRVERFVVVDGNARISLRRMLSTDAASFEVDGGKPVAIDIPTGWSHSLTNTGSRPLITQFWTHDLFDPASPDTYSTTQTL